jgi:hypothetical protein
MLYTVVTFVALFVAATTVAVIYYVKYEKQYDLTQRAQDELAEVMTPNEQRQGLGQIVGAIGPRKSGLGVMVDYLNQTVGLIKGEPVQDTTAEVKVQQAVTEATELINRIRTEDPNVEIVEPNSIGLVRVAEKLHNHLVNTREAVQELEDELKKLQADYSNAIEDFMAKKEELVTEKDEYYQRLQTLEADYKELKTLVEQTSEERVQNLLSQLEEAQAERERLEDELGQVRSEYRIAERRLEQAREQLDKYVGAPQMDVASYKPDGGVLMVDDRTQVVHINLGSNDRVYQGLTFSVYDKTAPIPKDGKGKAEVKVFNVEANISQARIINGDNKNPIIEGDMVANLIWDSEETNVFVVAGDFDLDGDGSIDQYAVERITNLVEQWGGKVEESVSVNTDYVILGEQPKLLAKPTFEQLEVYPEAMERYEASVDKLSRYRRIREQAETLSIPILNYERFLYFAGYKQQSQQPGAF